jgi:hypothetical protein
MENTHEAWLPCWGFWDVTEHAGPHMERLASTLTGVGLNKKKVLVVFGSDTKVGKKLTFVYDNELKRVWVRPGHAYLPYPPFHFGTTAQVLVGSLSDFLRILPPHTQK